MARFGLAVALVAALVVATCRGHRNHYHDVDVLGRRLFGREPSRYFCPSW
jgi:hypothetical protein